MAAPDHYQTLGVPKDASPDDIKKAFRTIAKENHPDVVGSDASKLQRFKDAKEAYDVLGDADARARYDRRGERVRMGSGFGFYRPPPPSQPSGAQAPSDLDLEDIFNDFSGGADFGFGRKGGTRSAPRPDPATPGRDIPLFVDIPSSIAENGGTVTVTYSRLKRIDGARSLTRVDELHELKVPPGTGHGSTLRVERMGDAGLNGGMYGDLVVDVTLVAPRARGSTGRMKMPRAEGPADPLQDDTDPGPPRRAAPETPVGEEHVRIDVGVITAILGGQVRVPTHTGALRVNVPPGTSSGARFRLAGKGAPDLNGRARDLVAELRLVAPKNLDAESRELLERFRVRNPEPE